MSLRLRPLLGSLAVAWLFAVAGSGAEPPADLVIEGADRAVPSSEADAEPPASSTAAAEDRSPEELFVTAGQRYEEGDYATSAELYRRLIDRGFDNGHLFYNLGNARLRNGELGRAIAAYRAARARLPRDREIAANLDFARKSTKDALLPPEPSAVASTLFFWHYELSARELASIAVALNLLFWGTLVALLFRPRWEPLRWLAVALLLPLLAVGASLAVRGLWPVRVAVVIPQEVEARTAPRQDAVVRFKLHAGTEVRVRERADGWVRIALPDGQQGWVEGAEVVTVTG